MEDTERWTLPQTRQQTDAGAGVRVWRCQLAALTTARSAYRCLSPQEHARAARLIDLQSRHLFLAAALMKRQVLAPLLGLSPAEVQFGAGPHGKPLIAPAQNPHDLRFNLSHSGTVALLAVARGREVGTDVERVRELQWRGVAAQVYTRAERGVLERLPAAAQQAAFFQLWTAKEAYLKALGCGFSLPPEHVSLGIQGREVCVEQAAPHDTARWQGRLLSVQDGYQAALVVQAAAAPLTPELLDWTPDAQPPCPALPGRGQPAADQLAAD
ncbi:4'-phosphopantetheinyl transferase superfamily protein (plasmid) [Deinococcus sp. KNUC1210]|uniref:4'-phosphopantetheinyl transferase family protein n=1 Tax=Deinococcus sp. KNUC1210 TaxID=2917691 RepID=UPI001EF0E7F3|nr:4'-phosphopantetheinyl transferase superfamily protein [Deinococcus sp. KNUC1210]ULH14297.1 4'-phosphopantetheinyl transferase superfamily protein [Deinococcus sp. KNUC1210]